jgi:hypothetical protein
MTEYVYWIIYGTNGAWSKGRFKNIILLFALDSSLPAVHLMWESEKVLWVSAWVSERVRKQGSGVSLFWRFSAFSAFSSRMCVASMHTMCTTGGWVCVWGIDTPSLTASLTHYECVCKWEMIAWGHWRIHWVIMVHSTPNASLTHSLTR